MRISIVTHNLLYTILISGLLFFSCSNDKPTEEIKSDQTIKKESINNSTSVKVDFLPGSVARYLVREQLANLDFPNDAIGETSEIEGTIYFDENGNIVQENSNIIVNVKSLKSDSSRRDKYLSKRSLKSNEFPKATISIKKIENLPWPLPKSGTQLVSITGDMTAHGVTDEITWDTSVNFKGNSLTGTAKTNFKFEKFEMDLPRVAIVLSVDDNIRLELEFIAEITHPE